MISEKDIHPLDLALNAAINGHPEVSEDLLRAQDQNDPRVGFNLGWHEMRHGRLLKGFEGMNMGRHINVFGSAPIGGPIPRPEDDLSGKHLLLRSEGGFGDEIINFRFARNFMERGAHVTISAHPAICPLFAREGYTVVTSKTAEDRGVYFDYWVPAMSAPTCLDLEMSDLDGAPYLTKPPVKKGDKLRIGLKWSGNPEFEHEQHRVFPTDLMFDAVKGRDVEYVSLQRDEGSELRPEWVEEVNLESWLDTAEQVARCDLVISSCTSIAHLSGAMGVPTWAVIPIMPYYIWALPGKTSPWYGSVELFRQVKYGEWDAPFEEIHNQLGDFIHANDKNRLLGESEGRSSQGRMGLRAVG